MSERIVTSDLHRAKQTASAISSHTGVPITKVTPGLHPWHLGQIEGKPTMQVLQQMNSYMIKHPDTAVPGRGENSTQPGESFNTFKRRFLGEMQGYMRDHEKDPSLKTAAVTHYRGMRLMEAWARKGFPKDMSIDVPHMVGKGDEPASVHRYHVDASGKWKGPQAVNMADAGQMKPGLFVVRHGRTAWNGANGAKPELDEK